MPSEHSDHTSCSFSSSSCSAVLFTYINNRTIYFGLAGFFWYSPKVWSIISFFNRFSLSSPVSNHVGSYLLIKSYLLYIFIMLGSFWKRSTLHWIQHACNRGVYFRRFQHHPCRFGMLSLFHLFFTEFYTISFWFDLSITCCKASKVGFLSDSPTDSSLLFPFIPGRQGPSDSILSPPSSQSYTAAFVFIFLYILCQIWGKLRS